MKKLLSMGLLAALIAVTCTPQTQAWSKFNFGMGFNVGWEGGGNTALFGLFKGENIPYSSGMPMGGFGGGGMDAPMMAPPSGGYPGSSGPEKVSPPTPLKPASYSVPQNQGGAYQAPAMESGYAAPSYWYGR